MIEVQGLTKRYGATVAVSDLTFTVRPGHVTGFLGPNGSGKSTTLRMVLGLDQPTSGVALVDGRPYRQLRAPLRAVGALIDARAVQGGRTAYHHLLALARSHRIPRPRVGEVLELVGLADAAGRRVGGFSLGMCQRLGIGAALLGDPEVLLLDEPVNGLDTEGIRWVRDLMRDQAARGRTVLVSSHVMSEMELSADRVVVIGRGRLVADTTVADLIARNSQQVTLVRAPHPASLRSALGEVGAGVETDPTGAWRVTGPDPETIGDVALAAGVALSELTPLRSSLEDVYTRLTDASVEFRAGRSDGAPGDDDQVVR